LELDPNSVGLYMYHAVARGPKRVWDICDDGGGFEKHRFLRDLEVY